PISDADVEYMLSVYREVLPILKKAVEEKNVRGYVRGEIIEPVFRKTSNFHTKPKQKKLAGA
ncbi:MAG: aspartate aminotransferase family protein, partial [Chlorobiales bacterium]|nr:aspartate aminotransferase family protein [Chlorobiales bacterium]